MKKNAYSAEGDDVTQLTDEIIELKEILREVSRKLTRMETKIKRGFSSNSRKASSTESQVASESKKAANLSSEQVLQLYEDLRLQVKSGHEEEVEQKLSEMNATDLNLLCWELGVSLSGRSPSRRKMLDIIMGRIKQSLMLSRHIDRQAP